MRQNRVFLLLSLILATSVFNGTAQDIIDVFEKKKDGYRNYRIPSLLATKDSVLLAFAEGRANLLDHSENDIVLKRSFDNGKTWNDLQVVAEDSTNALNNPQCVQRSDGRVILMYQRYAEGFGERDALPGLDGDRICRTDMVFSDDSGASWSLPEDITEQAKRPEATSVASGPGVGIELKKGKYKGRLVMPFNQGPWGNWFVYMVYSDDGGKTWQKGEIAPYKKKIRGWANEVQVVELEDGRLMLNARSERGNRKRKIGFSSDGGKTWTALEDDKKLLDPECQGSFIKHSSGTLLFCNPRHRTRRVRGTIYGSSSNATEWEHRKTIYKDGFAYSSMAELPNGEIGILFERDGYDTISFMKVKLEEILDPKTK